MGAVGPDVMWLNISALPSSSALRMPNVEEETASHLRRQVMSGNKDPGGCDKPGNTLQGGWGVRTKGSEIRNESPQEWGIKP